MTGPRPGDWIVVATDGPAAAVIRGFEWHAANEADRPFAWANHAAIVADGYLIEANPRGVQMAPLEKYAGHHWAWSSRELSDEQREEIVGGAVALLGIPYSWLDILAIGASALGAVPDPVWHRLNRPDRLICSQLVAHVYEAAGDPLDKGPSCRVTPAMLARPRTLTGRPA